MPHSKTYFVKQGSAFRTTNEDNLQVSKTLPLGHYTIMIDQKGFYIDAIPDITVEGKIYGDVSKRAERILHTFSDRSNNTGVLLEGEKGSGKTLLGRILASELYKQGISTVVINQPLFGEEFNSLIASIDQPLMIMFDEFEKVYPAEHQQKLLTLLDGTYSKKKLFVVTCNDGFRVVDFMKNRPGRMFYKYTYKGLSAEFIKEYAEDTLKNKAHVDNVVEVAENFNAFNFDMLKAMVEEMNRYNETAGDVLNHLNATPAGQTSKFKIVEVVSKTIPDKYTEFDTHINDGEPLNPFNHFMYFYGRTKATVSKKAKARRDPFDDSRSDELYINFGPKDITHVRAGRFVVENEMAKVTFVKEPVVERQTWRDYI